MTHASYHRKGRSLLSVWTTCLLLLLLGSSCTLKLIADYDQYSERTATELQKRMDQHLTNLEAKAGTPAAEYAANVDFYNTYLVDVRSLEIRARSRPKNDITIQQLPLIIDSTDELRAAHEDSPLPKEAIPTYRDLFNQAWGAIIKLELAKKRGE